MVRLRIKLADIPIDVSVLYQETAEKYREFLTEDFPVFSVVVTPSELHRERDALVRLLQGSDRPVRGISSAADLEGMAVYHQIAECLPQFDAMLIHGSAVALEGQAYLFLAPSGTGKSTHARLWREHFGPRAVMVNDDKPMLRFREDGVWVCGTPWQGKHDLGNNIMAPLRAAVILTRDRENHVERITGAEAFPALLQQLYVYEDAAHAAQMLRLAERLADSVPLYRLGCNMTPDAARAAYEGIHKEDV